ncbi:hypothetical protein FrEUN1fDRAFT_5464 [Parafrankia sp. EUN1f]|nr:hypothetical protein FrEUN1fDRAFT_5464 [Parafrankia sp. EUN1f]
MSTTGHPKIVRVFAENTTRMDGHGYVYFTMENADQRHR